MLAVMPVFGWRSCALFIFFLVGAAASASRESTRECDSSLDEQCASSHAEDDANRVQSRKDRPLLIGAAAGVLGGVLIVAVAAYCLHAKEPDHPATTRAEAPVAEGEDASDMSPVAEAEDAPGDQTPSPPPSTPPKMKPVKILQRTFCRLNVPRCTAMGWILIPAYCSACS